MRLLGTLLLLVGSFTGCGGGEDYCAAVEAHQAELTDITASASPAALLEALPIFRDLAESAPEDLRDEWRMFLDPLRDLDEALRAADIDPSSYDPDDLPESLDSVERQRIEDDAIRLADPAVAAAFDGIQQQAKDVCHTPLSL